MRVKYIPQVSISRTGFVTWMFHGAINEAASLSTLIISQKTVIDTNSVSSIVITVSDAPGRKHYLSTGVSGDTMLPAKWI